MAVLTLPMQPPAACATPATPVSLRAATIIKKSVHAASVKPQTTCKICKRTCSCTTWYFCLTVTPPTHSCLSV